MTVDTPKAPKADSQAAPSIADDVIYSFGASFTGDAFLSLGSMEGVYEPVVTKARSADKAAPALAPGYLLAGTVTALAYLIHHLPFAPFSVIRDGLVRHPVSATIIAILVGLGVRNVLTLPHSIRAGCKHIVKKIIPVAIVLTGAGLNLAHIASVGLTALMITMVCIGVALLSGYYIGRCLGLNWKTALLIGTGTGICGNSAIVAVAPLVDADDDDLVLSIGTVNLFGLAAMLALPALGGLLHLKNEVFGIWAGTTIHAVPQVVAAGFALSPEAGAMATLVKLVRVTMLAPLVFILAILYAKHHSGDIAKQGRPTVRYARLVPWFVWGFVIFAALNTVGMLPTLDFQLADFITAWTGTSHATFAMSGMMTQAGKVLLTLAMAAIGLEVNLRVLAGVGGRAFQTGLLSTIVVGATSLLLLSMLL